MSIPRSLFGFYEAVGNPDQADCIMGHSFGTDTSEHGVNRQLVDIMRQYADGKPIIADRMLVRADPQGEKYMPILLMAKLPKWMARVELKRHSLMQKDIWTTAA